MRRRPFGLHRTVVLLAATHFIVDGYGNILAPLLPLLIHNLKRFRATLVGAQHDVVLLQPKTRIPVPVQAVAYDSILRIEPRKGGQGVGKAVAIGVAAGVGTFFGVMALLVAALGD
jgi:hypothetical protein